MTGQSFRAGLITRWVLTKGFRSAHSPFPGFAWRTNTSFKFISAQQPPLAASCSLRLSESARKVIESYNLRITELHNSRPTTRYDCVRFPAGAGRVSVLRVAHHFEGARPSLEPEGARQIPRRAKRNDARRAKIPCRWSSERYRVRGANWHVLLEKRAPPHRVSRCHGGRQTRQGQARFARRLRRPLTRLPPP